MRLWQRPPPGAETQDIETRGHTLKTTGSLFRRRSLTPVAVAHQIRVDWGWVRPSRRLATGRPLPATAKPRTVQYEKPCKCILHCICRWMDCMFPFHTVSAKRCLYLWLHIWFFRNSYQLSGGFDTNLHCICCSGCYRCCFEREKSSNKVVERWGCASTATLRRRPTVTRIDRLAHNTFDLFAIVKRIVDAGGQFRSLAELWADTGIGRLNAPRDTRHLKGRYSRLAHFQNGAYAPFPWIALIGLWQSRDLHPETQPIIARG